MAGEPDSMIVKFSNFINWTKDTVELDHFVSRLGNRHASFKMD